MKALLWREEKVLFYERLAGALRGCVLAQSAALLTQSR